MRNLILLILFSFVFTQSLYAYEVKEISYLRVNSAITPATYDYLKFSFAKFRKGTLAVIKLNTPGGLVTTTKDILTLIGDQEFPVAVWITPEGASAASAGSIIAAGAHFILMSPGTNMGAATPVGLGEDIKEGDGRKKAMNDLSALIRSLSSERGRPSKPFEEMISKAESFTDKEAQTLKIIDGVISKDADVETALAGKKFKIKGSEETLLFASNFQIQFYDSTAGQKLLEILANPSSAYFLFLIGVALLYFELQAPGGYIAGSVGIVFLILAAIAFQVLPLDLGALGLIVFGIILLILEMFITSYGLLLIGGVASFIAGSLFLFHGEEGYISVEYTTMFATLAGVTLASGLVFWYLWRDRKKQKKVADFFMPQGARGVVMGPLKEGYQVKVKGETWKALSPDPLHIGDAVEVTSVDEAQLIIHVKKS